MENNPLSLRESYDAVLGGIMAISPPLYREALKEVARLAGREFDDKFRKDISDIQKQISEENEGANLDW